MTSGTPTSIMEAGLTKRLRSRPDLHLRSVEVSLLPTSGVAITKAGSRLGVWVWTAGQFAYQADAGGATVTAQTIMGATALTCAMVDDGE